MPPRLGAKNRPTGFLALSSWENKFFQLGIFLQNSIRNENRIIILNNVQLHYDIWLTDLRGLSTDKICRASRCHTKKEGGEIILRPHCLSVQAVVLRLLLQECFSLYTLSSCRAISCHDRHPHIRSQHQPSLPGHLRYNP